MSDDLADYLGSVDTRLVGYLDAERDISVDAIRHVQCYAIALNQGLVVAEHVHEDWPDFFPLVVAIVLAYGSPRLGHLARHSALFEGGGYEPLSPGDHVFMLRLLAELRGLLTQRES